MKNKVQNGMRIWELDLLRGIALILMVYFHTIYDLKEFYSLPVSYEAGVNFYIGKFSAILFILISGISCALSKNNTKRGLKVLGASLVITIASYLFAPSNYVKFGILHFLGICILLSSIFNKLNKYMLLILGTGIIIIGNFTSGVSTTNPFLFPLGIITKSFISSDFYPLIPWLGGFLYGISLGKFLYAEKRSIFTFNIKENLISKAGRHTLLIYLVHQPAIVAVLYILDQLKII